MIKYTFLEKLSILNFACFGVWEGRVKNSLTQRINGFANAIIILFFIDLKDFYNHTVFNANNTYGDLIKAFYMGMIKDKLESKGLLEAFKDQA